jgi:Fe(3+) dicitrate transport protein
MANLNTTCGNEGRLRYYDTWGVEPRLRVDHRLFGLRNEADLGLRLHFETQERRQENGDTPTSRTGTVVENNLRQNQAHAGFIQNRVLFGRWTLTPGLRIEHVRYERTNRLANAGAGVSGSTIVTQLVPGFGLAYASGDRYTVFAGVHRGFAPPRTEDIITNAGGTVDLDPELSWNYEVGMRSLVSQGVRLDGTVFRMDYENQIVPASLAGGVGATLTNGGQTLHQGLELSGRIDTGTIVDSHHNVYGRVAYTYLPTARFTGTRFSGVPGFGSVSVAGNRLPYAPRQIVTATVGYSHPFGADVRLEAARVSEQFGDDLNTIAPTADGQRGLIPPQMIWNASTSYRLRRFPATLFITVKNLRDAIVIVDRTRGILANSPRLVQAGVRLRF